MTFNDSRVLDSRKPLTLYEAYLDACRYEYGKSYTNLYRYSQDFANVVWTTGSVQEDSNVVIAPDGTLTADKVYEDTLTTQMSKGQVLSGLTANSYYTYSIYVKSAEYTTLSVWNNFSSETAKVVAYDIENVNITSYGDMNATIEDKGDGWVRITYTMLLGATTSGYVYFYLKDTTSRTGDGVSGLYFWGAMFNAGNKAGHYVMTTTAAASGGCSAVNAKANLTPYSEQFNNWSLTGTPIVTANSTIAPDGTLTADTIEDDDAAFNEEVNRSITVADDITQRTYSVYLKQGTASDSQIIIHYSGGTFKQASLAIQWSTLILTPAGDYDNYGMESVGNGWYRIWVTCSNNASGNTLCVYRVVPAKWITGGTTTGSVHAWGAQLVEGNQAGIYYKTEASAFSGTVGAECYNTWNTCEVTVDFDKILKRYRFYQPTNEWPVGSPGYPCAVGKPRFTPCEIDPKGSLGKRGIVTFSLEDFVDDDVETDPYYATRTYDPESQGTFFGKLKRRMPHYKGRTLKVGQGYINDPFSFNDFRYKTYIVEALEFSTKGRVSIKAKDLLKLADDKRAALPLASTGTLSAAYTAGVSTTLVLQTGEGVNYVYDDYNGAAISGSNPGYVRVGDNVLRYTGVSTDTLTGVTGAWFGSADADAGIDDSVQKCLYFNSQNVVDIIHYLLKTGAGITENFLPYDAGLTTPTGTNDEWDIEKANWLSGNDLTKVITEATGIKELLQQICEQNLIYIWFDENEQKIKLKAIAPALKNETPPTINENQHIVKGSVEVMDNEKNRISEIWVYYDQIDVTGDRDKAENYRKLKIQVDTDSENENAYAEKAIRVIYADWFTGANAGLIITLVGRLLSRYSGSPKFVKLQVDNKDANVWAGNSIKLNTKYFQGVDGANEIQGAQILKSYDDHDKQLVYLEAETWNYLIYRYGFVTPNSMGNYTAESEANQNAYGFISQNDGYYTNGDLGHLIA